MEWKYVKATTSEKIEAVKKKYDVQLPEDLEKLILKSNNGRPVKSTFDSERTRGLEFKKLLSYNTEDMENIYTFIHNVQVENELLINKIKEKKAELEADLKRAKEALTEKEKSLLGRARIFFNAWVCGIFSCGNSLPGAKAAG